MIQIEEAVIRQMILHRVSNAENKLILSNTLIDHSDGDEENFLKKVFLKPFLSHSQTFEFKHDVDKDFNVLFNLSKKIYEGSEFKLTSQDIVRHLVTASKHPKINDGDLFIIKLEDIKLNNKFFEAIGIYKFEDKDSFLETFVQDKEAGLRFRKGIGNRKPEKACLIIFSEDPYTILIIDNNSHETDYWQNDFINQKAKNDNVNSTNNVLSLTKDFILTQIPQDFEISRADQINLLNRSVDYFKSRDTFEQQGFEEEVFADEDIIDSFQKFNKNYTQEKQVEILNNFEISPQAVKKQSRALKSILKLDKNFHVYIHASNPMNQIEKGVDSDGRKYYKLYYDHES